MHHVLLLAHHKDAITYRFNLPLPRSDIRFAIPFTVFKVCFSRINIEQKLNDGVVLVRGDCWNDIILAAGRRGVNRMNSFAFHVKPLRRKFWKAERLICYSGRGYNRENSKYFCLLMHRNAEMLPE